jgi:CRP-like cAMP-binding protein
MKKKLDNKWEELLKERNLNESVSNIGISSIKLPLGKKFIEKDSFPSGVLFLTSGRMREISFDYNNEPFTTRIYEQGDFVGSEQLLRGENSILVTASTNVEGYLMNTDNFLKLSISSPEFLDFFSKISKTEIFYSLKKIISLKN